MVWTNEWPPDPLSAGTVAEFVDQLRSLKVWAGDPSFEELRRRSGLASSTLSDALNPQRARLPRLETVRGFVLACGASVADRRRWESAWRSLQGGSSARRTPHLLPRPAVPFIGRRGLLDRLDAARRDQAGRREPALALLVGGAGTGKTATVLHWAHRVAPQHPDGQLHIELDAFAGSPAVTVQAALERLLRALGVPSADLPPDAADRIALYRSLTYPLRLLVVLDDARDSAQVAPLLPAGPDCLTVVTSRSRLSGLVAREGGHRLQLSALDERESVALLAAIVGTPRAEREPAALARLAILCGGLPLALRLAAVDLADRPEQRISAYVELLTAAGPLDGLASHGDRAGDLRAAFDASYQALDEPTRALLPAVPAAGGLVFTVREVAARAGLPGPEVRRLLHALAAVHLLEPAGSDGYRMNPLVHAWARERARAALTSQLARPRPSASVPLPTSDGRPAAART